MSQMEKDLRSALLIFVARYPSDAKLWPVDRVKLLLAAYRLLFMLEDSDDAE